MDLFKQMRDKVAFVASRPFLSQDDVVFVKYEKSSYRSLT